MIQRHGDSDPDIFVFVCLLLLSHISISARSRTFVQKVILSSLTSPRGALTGNNNNSLCFRHLKNFHAYSTLWSYTFSSVDANLFRGNFVWDNRADFWLYFNEEYYLLKCQILTPFHQQSSRILNGFYLQLSIRSPNNHVLSFLHAANLVWMSQIYSQTFVNLKAFNV